MNATGDHLDHAALVPPTTGNTLGLTVEETSKLLDAGLRQTYEAVRRGDIPAVKIGGKWYVKRAELLRLFGLSAGNE